MALILHITIALGSLLSASYLLARPSRSKLYANYGLVVATIASGTYLVISTHTALLAACASGLFYLAAVSILLVIAARKLAVAPAHRD